MKRRASGLAIAAATLLAATPALADPAPLAQFGTGVEGGAAGQLAGPTATVIDAAGNAYVADTDNYRIAVFAADGTFQRAFGKDVVPGGAAGFEVCTKSCKLGVDGEGPGDFSVPYGVALDRAGELLVADYGNNRVNVFDREGNFLRAFGKDVVPGGGTGPEVCTTSCQAGVMGGAPGEFSSPIGLAGGSDGLFYAPEYDSHRVSVFDAAGNFIRAFGRDVVPGGGTGSEVCTTACQIGTPGGGPGELANPTGIAADLEGHLYVGEQGGNRVSVFNLDGSFVRAFGKDVVPGGGTGAEVCTSSCQSAMTGTGPGELSSPDGLAFDPLAGIVYAVEQDTNRASAFTAEGAFLRAFGKDVVPGGATGFEICTGTCQAGVLDTAAGALDAPFLAGSDCRGALYAGDYGNERIQRFGEPGTELPPCPLELGQVKRNKKKGTAKLEAIVPEPGPGDLKLRGKGLKKKQLEDVAPDELTLGVKPKGRTKRDLKEDGKEKVKAKVTYTPLGGEPETLSRKITLKRR